MSKTLELRRLITEQLNTITGATYYRVAPDSAVYPYKTFELSSINMGDLARDDIDLCIDIWDHEIDSKAVETIADEVDALFSAKNMPQDHILPTFYRDTRNVVKEENKTIQHIQMHFTVQNYTR